MKNKKIIFGIITIIWVGVIFSFSLQPGEESGDMSMSVLINIIEMFLPGVAEKLESMPQEQLDTWHFILRKCAHFTEYFILGLLSTITLLQTEWKRKSAIGIAFCMCIAGIDETIQLFVSGRAGRVQDVLIDSAGAAVGIVLVLLFLRMSKRRGHR